MPSRLLVAAATAAVALTPIALAAPAHAATHTVSTVSPAAGSNAWTPRPAQYASTVTTKDLAIPMSDGVVLRGDLTRPADAAGNPISTGLPVVVTITAYNKSASSGSPLAGSSGSYLVQRGYDQLTVDARGT